MVCENKHSMLVVRFGQLRQVLRTLPEPANLHVDVVVPYGGHVPLFDFLRKIPTL